MPLVAPPRPGTLSITLTGLDGLRALEVVQAAYRSVELGQPVALARAEPSIHPYAR